jgi:hypothetical protein
MRGTATTVDDALVSPADQFNVEVVTRVPPGESATKPADDAPVTVTDTATADAFAGTPHLPPVTCTCHVDASTALWMAFAFPAVRVSNSRQGATDTNIERPSRDI